MDYLCACGLDARPAQGIGCRRGVRPFSSRASCLDSFSERVAEILAAERNRFESYPAGSWALRTAPDRIVRG